MPRDHEQRAITPFEQRVLDLIRASSRPPDMPSVARSLRVSEKDAAEALCGLRRRGLVKIHTTATRLRYRLSTEADR